MKKNFKFIMLALFVSFAFVLSACGGTPGQLDTMPQANIGEETSYSIATVDQVAALETYMENETATEVNSYRLSLEMKMGDVTVMSYNSIFSVIESNYELAIKMVTDMNEDGNLDTAYVYYKDGYMYGEALGQKYKTPVEGDVASDPTFALLFSLNLDAVLNMVKSTQISTQNLKVSSEGDITRFALEEVGAKMYLIFDNGQLIQCAASTVESGMETNVIIESYDETIQFPNFDEYQLFEE